MGNLSVQRPAASLSSLSVPAEKTAEKAIAQKPLEDQHPQVVIEADNYKCSHSNDALKSGQAATPSTPVMREVKIFPGVYLITDEPIDTAKRNIANGALRGGLAAGSVSLVPTLGVLATTKNAFEKELSPMLVGGGALVTALSGAAAGAVSSQMTDKPIKGVFMGVLAGAATGAVTGGALGRSGYGAAVGTFVGAISGVIGGIAGLSAKKEEE